jgi:hypothetical protein
MAWKAQGEAEDVRKGHAGSTRGPGCGRRAATGGPGERLAELALKGGTGSKRKWWAFEGFTEVDCVLETDRLLLFIEGKRTEALASSTDWYPERSQLVRNLEAVREVAKGRTAAVLLVTQEPVADEITADSLPRACLISTRPSGKRWWPATSVKRRGSSSERWSVSASASRSSPCPTRSTTRFASSRRRRGSSARCLPEGEG